jgi:branched-chain amino acid aminotransferase
MSEFKININLTKNSNINSVDFENIKFGRVNTDHMFICHFKDGKWQDGEIKPFQNISLSPATSALHYGQSIFEGMRCQKSTDGEDILLFRPEENFKRLNLSAKRMCMPEIPEQVFNRGLETLIAIDHEWIPTTQGSGLYIRPFYFASDNFLGVKESEDYIFIIYCCPVNAYYSNPLSVWVEQRYSRATKQGGVGYAKCAGNYAASMYPAKLAKEKGYDQVMWTDSEKHELIEETGTTNIFAQIGGIIVTPSLSDSILPGITRESIITFLKSKNYVVEERELDIHELVEASINGMLKEMWVSGTAATVVNIKRFHFNDKDYEVPMPENGLKDEILQALVGIKRGEIEDSFGWMKKVKPKTSANLA